MYVLASRAAVDEMGYAMNWLEIDSDLFNGGKTVHRGDNNQRSNKPVWFLDHEIAHLTRLKSGSHELLSQTVAGRRELPISTVKMLAGRECNYSRRGRFSSVDCCHVLR